MTNDYAVLSQQPTRFKPRSMEVITANFDCNDRLCRTSYAQSRATPPDM